MKSELSITRGVARSVRHFWVTRMGQAARQQKDGRRDQGSRGAVTGGKQMDGFISFVHDLICDCGLSTDSLFMDSRLELPGYYRPEKKWDLLVVDQGTLVAAIKFKSQIGPSFGNNFNNRSEEAIGTAQDIWTAYREGAFSVSERPWLGYLMMLEDCPRSNSPVSVREPHFPVFPDFLDASYAQRYQILMNRLVRERLYDSACFLMSSYENGSKGRCVQPVPTLSFMQFYASLAGRISSFVSGKRFRDK